MELADLDHEVRRLEDVHEISNLMGRRAFVHAAARNDVEFERYWAADAADISFEPEDWGIWHGRDHIDAIYVRGNPFPGDTPGLMIEHALTTPIIEVAADGRTAKGMWISPGHETFPIVPGEQPKPHWSWGRYTIDFINENGSWRIWHLHVLTTFRTPYDQSWVDSSISRPEYFPEAGEVMPGMPPPDGPVTFNQPYSLTAVPQLQPPLPEPYGTWSETFSYGAERVARSTEGGSTT